MDNAPRNSNSLIYSKGEYYGGDLGLFTPTALSNDAVVTITAAGAASRAVVGSRPATVCTFDTDANDVFQTQLNPGFYFTNVGDALRIRTSLRWNSDFVNDIGCFIGAANSGSALIGTPPTDGCGIMKANTATVLSLWSRDDSGTAETSAMSNTLVHSTWYDIDVTMKRTGTNTGQIWCRVATSASLAGQWSTVNQQFLSVAAQFPDADVILYPTLAFATAGTVTGVINVDRFQWLAARGAV